MIRLRVAVARPCEEDDIRLRLRWWGSVVWFLGERLLISENPSIWWQRMEPSPCGTNLLAKS